MSCFYCGCDSSSSRDHVIPVSYLGHARDYQKGDIVLCCKECNSLLSDKPIFTVEERADYLSRAIFKKYKKYIQSPVWSEYELEEMDDVFVKSIRAAMMISDWARSRINHCLKVSLEMYDESLISNLSYGRTIREVVCYKFIALYCSHHGNNKQAIDFASSKCGLTANQARDIVRLQDYESSWINYKYDMRIPMDTPRSRVRELMKMQGRA